MPLTPRQRPGHAEGVEGATARREQVEETLKDLDIKQKKSKNPPLQIKIEQAGLAWSKNRFLITAAGLGLFAFLGVRHRSQVATGGTLTHEPPQPRIVRRAVAGSDPRVIPAAQSEKQHQRASHD